MDLYESYMDLHWLLLLLIDFALGLIDVYGFMLIYMPSNYVYTCFCRVYELGVAYKRAAGAFCRKKKAFPVFLTCQFCKNSRIVRISLIMDVGTCQKRRAPENHQFWRY